MGTLLVLLTHSFPFEQGETFLDNEVEYSEIFDNVIIAPLTSGDIVRYKRLNSNVSIVKVGGIMSIYEKIGWGIKSVFSPYFWNEIRNLIKDRNFSFSRLIVLMGTTAYGERLSEGVYKALKNKYVNMNSVTNITIYSYWLTGSAYSALRLKDKITIENKFVLSRCHGHDIYEYRKKDDYLPFRRLFLTKLDSIYPISLNGVNYLKKKYSFAEDNKINPAYLGTRDYGINLVSGGEKKFTIVSCSSLIPLKRVHLIIDAIERLKDENIQWIHIGGGDLFNNIKRLAEDKLGKEIEFELIGNLTYEQVISFYVNTPVHLFINTSEFEGIPVSIMEAISFGIPVIATEVGGVSEIVHDKYNGYLLNKDFNIDSLVDLILKVINMPEREYQDLRKRAREYWNDNFNAELNYRTFYSEISNKYQGK